MRHLIATIGAAAASTLAVAAPATASAAASPHNRYIAAQGLTVSGASTAGPSTGTATPGGIKSATVARANVTDIKEVKNDTKNQISLFKREDGSRFSTTPISAYSTKAGNMWIPWVGDELEMQNKSIVVYRGNNPLYSIFQDYWDPDHRVRFSTSNSYAGSLPVLGDSTGGGRKRLIIRSDGPYMEATN